MAKAPAEFTVSQLYPNPFNPSTALEIKIPEAAAVRVVMYNVIGQEIHVLHDEMIRAGTHPFVWDERNNAGEMATSGVYFYTVKAGMHSAKGKVMFLR